MTGRSLIGSLIGQKAAAQAPVQYAPRQYGGFRQSYLSPSTSESSLHAMGTLGDVYSIVELLSSSVAAVEWKLYRKQRQDGRRTFAPPVGDADDRTEVIVHPALSVWKRPNRFFTNRMFAEGYQQHIELTGEAYWVLGYNGLPTPTSMWYVMPHRMVSIPDPDNFLAGYVYMGPSGEQVPLQLHEVIKVIGHPCPWDPYHGLGPVQSIMVDIQNARYSAEWNRNYWFNSATPGGIVEVPNGWDDVKFNEFTDRWRESHRGVSAAGAVGVLEGGARWVDTQKTMQQMQGAELRDVSAKTIRRAWGVHPSMIGDVEDVNRANALTARESFARDKVVPRLDTTKDILNSFYLPLWYGGNDPDVEFDYVDAVPEDREAQNATLTAKVNAAVALVTAGWDPDDALDACELPAMAFGGGQQQQQQQLPAATPADDAMMQQDIETMNQMGIIWNTLLEARSS